jgi:hypothetical protein
MTVAETLLPMASPFVAVDLARTAKVTDPDLPTPTRLMVQRVWMLLKVVAGGSPVE